ncbi:MAG: KaiC 1 [Verrucomicrobia bacterium]|nr:MAG: KaiC 1 [Verrucomicrobiota bacterium]
MRPAPDALAKTPTGIAGLDDITNGGLPKGRPSLVCGSAGAGKTLLAMEFLVRGAVEFGEPGVFMAFEENEDELTRNVASLGFDLKRLVAQKKMALDHVRIERAEIEETGEYDLEGLFVRLNTAIEAIGAKRVVLDTIEALFASLPNEGILRAELRRLFRWLKQKGLTAIITGERGNSGSLTRHGLEEYVADCVIVLDHRITNQVSTRRLRVLKYRGSLHGTNEYPFLIGRSGISVLPVTSLGLAHPAPTQRISTGVPRLDSMFSGNGYLRGSSVLISGTAGTGKTSLASAFALAACKRGQRAVYFAFEESPQQIMRNMRSVGIDLRPCVSRGTLCFHSVRPSHYGLEQHLLAIHELVEEIKPRVVVVDPVTNLLSVGDPMEVRSMLTRLIDFFKTHQITALFTSLTVGDADLEQTEVGISSLMDTWLLVRNLEHNGERNRALYILKSRGMAHSNQVREFVLSSRGIELVDIYTGGGEVLTGTARIGQEAEERRQAQRRLQEFARLQRDAERKRRATEAQIAMLKAQLETDLEELKRSVAQEDVRKANSVRDRKTMARERMADQSNSEVRTSKAEARTAKGGARAPNAKVRGNGRGR